MPTARIYDESVYGYTLYGGNPDQKITMTSAPYDWFEASFFYTNVKGLDYGSGFTQDYKDKGFNLKAQIKKEGTFPAIAIGFNDIAGTGYYSSEYIVGSYGINNLDIHFGLGWGTLNGSKNRFKNPLSYLHDSFLSRPTNTEGEGGQFQPSRYFSGTSTSPFFGFSYAINKNFLLKIENDTTRVTQEITNSLNYKKPKSAFSASLDYSFNENFTIGIAQERGSHFSIKFIYKQNASAYKDRTKYEKVSKQPNEDKYGYFVKNLESNGIGVNRIIETSESIGLELTQFSHPNLDIIEEILFSAKRDAGIKKDIKTEYRIADLKANSEFSEDYIRGSKLIYERQREQRFNSSTKGRIRPFLAAREGFLKLGFILENDIEYIIQDNFFFSSNLKYTIKDNFEDLVVPPITVYPAQVRSDVKDYLRNFEGRIIIGRAQFDYHITPKKNNHIMLSAGILEEMFNGIGLEYLYFNSKRNYAVGFEIFEVKKRDYELRFGTLDYQNTTGHINYYYRNYNLIPFDAKISYGEYLAGDKGITFELSRSYLNGANFGVFASFTDVTADQFGEGSFDKGIFFNIPIYKNFIEYSWRPLTKDPGARLTRKHTLHDLLVKFKPYNK